MTPDLAAVVVPVALASAFLHAAWNAGVKAARDPQGAMAAQVVASGLLSLPLLLVVPLPAAAALPWLAGSAVFNLLTMLAMLRGYASGGGFGFVYPLARAISPLLVLLLAGERVGGLAIAGIALVSGGVALFAGGEGRRRPAALGWALLAGTLSAGYALCDAHGARASGSIAGYGLAVSMVNAISLGSFHRFRNRVRLLDALRAHPRMATAGSSAAIGSYLLILWVWSHAPIAIGAALRDTSVVFAALLAILLGERLTPVRLAAILLAVAGTVAIRFA
ncbi:MAG: hypothetical protein J0H67_01125 [Rhodospirillales bacterium]|nr:hypothetical protein [Rhodospirillales bacterium]